jgi:predicted component of type VI protein secretion system
MATLKTWLIDSALSSGIVVSEPSVSGRHCLLARTTQGYTIEDLRSTNGTFVAGVRIDGATPIQPGDRVTLGPSVPMPWTDEGVQFPHPRGSSGSEPRPTTTSCSTTPGSRAIMRGS